ncbi:MAG: tetratricopeptide repeat protein [Candidatus Helarchaeota archaeon]
MRRKRIISPSIKEMVHAKSLHKKALKLRKKGRLLKAIDLLEKSIKLYPEFREAYLDLGKIFELIGDSDGAKECFLKATGQEARGLEDRQPIIEKDPVQVAYQAINDIEKKALTKKESVSKRIREEHRVDVKSSKVDPAIQQLRDKIRASMTGSGRIDAQTRQKIKEYLELALFFESVEEYDKTREMLEKIIRVEKRNVKIWEKLGSTYARLFRFGEALYCFERACRLEPTADRKTMIEALKKLAFSHDPLKKPAETEAEEYFNFGIKLYIQRNDIIRAVHYFKKAIYLDPNYEMSWIVKELRKQHGKLLKQLKRI